jgi:hypothetical protein
MNQEEEYYESLIEEGYSEEEARRIVENDIEWGKKIREL